MTFHPIPLNFLIYEENFIFFLSVGKCKSFPYILFRRKTFEMLRFSFPNYSEGNLNIFSLFFTKMWGNFSVSTLRYCRYVGVVFTRAEDKQRPSLVQIPIRGGCVESRNKQGIGITGWKWLRQRVFTALQRELVFSRAEDKQRPSLVQIPIRGGCVESRNKQGIGITGWKLRQRVFTALQRYQLPPRHLIWLLPPPQPPLSRVSKLSLFLNLPVCSPSSLY